MKPPWQEGFRIVFMYWNPSFSAAIQSVDNANDQLPSCFIVLLVVYVSSHRADLSWQVPLDVTQPLRLKHDVSSTALFIGSVIVTTTNGNTSSVDSSVKCSFRLIWAPSWIQRTWLLIHRYMLSLYRWQHRAVRHKMSHRRLRHERSHTSSFMNWALIWFIVEVLLPI